VKITNVIIPKASGDAGSSRCISSARLIMAVILLLACKKLFKFSLVNDWYA
jgi:hypothetical protein